jgi:RHS repeat-associated protein
LLRISQALEADSPKTEAQATEAQGRGLLGIMGGKTEKSTVTLPGFGESQWASLNSAVAHLAKNGYNAQIREVLRQGGLDPEALEATAKAAIAQQTAEQTAKLTIQMYHCNHLGTPIALINTQGMIDWAVELDPWGNVLNEFNPQNIDQPIRMQGQQVDRESGLFYNRHRYYDPQMGRYITQDPIGLAGGVNLCKYVSNPNQWVDPSGLNTMAIGAGAGFAVGGPPGALVGGVIGGLVLLGGLIWMASSSNEVETPTVSTERSEYDAYKNRCKEPPPDGLSKCADALFRDKRNRDCLKMRQDWDAKWHPNDPPAGHAGEIESRIVAVARSAADVVKHCKPGQ